MKGAIMIMGIVVFIPITIGVLWVMFTFASIMVVAVVSTLQMMMG